MVAAAVHADVGSDRIHGVLGVGFAASRDRPTLDATLAVASDAVSRLPATPGGPVVTEHGEFYEEPTDTVALWFRPGFKYIESIAERETVQAAHHAAYAARELVR